MRLLWVLLLALLLMATPAAAQAPDRPANWMAITFGSLAGADIGMSMNCMGAGTCREANPLLRPLQDHPAFFGAAKAGFNTATVVGIYKWTQPKSTRRYVALGTLIAVQAVVVGLNARQLSKQPKPR